MKQITSVSNDVQDKISFESKVYKRQKRIMYRKIDDPSSKDEDDHFYLKDLEDWKIFDVIRYNKKEIQTMVAEFLKNNNLQSIQKRIKGIRVSEKFIESHNFAF